MDPQEKAILESYVKKFEAQEEYHWALEFISEDYLSAFDRSREFLGKIFNDWEEDERLSQLMETWDDNHAKGYITEMEMTAMINLAKDWRIERPFMEEIQKINR
jgi:hypothetical protein